jgi:anti-sigma-K factor RskA
MKEKPPMPPSQMNSQRDRVQHEEIRELLPGYALGILTEDEQRRVEAHLVTCTDCRVELDRFRTTVLVLALAAPEREPPGSLRTSIRAAVQQQGERVGTPQAVRSRFERWRERFQQRVALAWGLAVVALLASFILAGWNVMLQRQLSGVQYRIAAGTVSGNIRYLPSEQILVIDLRGLPTLPAERVYQLWAIPDGTPVPMATFTETTRRIAVVGDPATLGTLAITVEPGPLGSPSPTSQPLVMIDLRHQRGTAS